MTIHERAAVALARARAAAAPASLVDTAHQRRLRAAMIRDVATLLAVPPEQVLVTDDPVRAYGSMPGQLITVQDPDDPTVLLRFIPEPGNTGAYLLLAACPACSRLDRVRKVPTLSIACLADLGAGAASTDGGRRYEPDQVAVEFFDDLQHEPDCPLR
jgi:hypothetical protein